MPMRQSMPVELTKDELGITNDALNEVCSGIHLEGCTIEEARELGFKPLRQVDGCCRLIATSTR